MHFFIHFAQAASDARLTAEPHPVTYVDFLTVTLTAMCVLLATLGFIVAVLAVIGYRDIKRAAVSAAEKAIDKHLAQYPNAAEIHSKFKVVDGYMSQVLRKEKLLARVRNAPNDFATPSKIVEDKPVKRPNRYPRKGD